MKRVLALLVVLALAPACTRAVRYVPPDTAKLVVVPVGLARPDTKAQVVVAQVAATDEERHRGLGGRPVVEPGEGMLFVYPRAGGHHFWMKDCLVGLDIAFIGEDARILSIATLGPGAGLSDADIPAVDSPAPVRYVLETAAGWLASKGLAVGDEVDVSRAVDGVTPR